MKLRDYFWLWGHPEGSYNNNNGNYGNLLDSRMTPMEACLYLGIRNTFMTPRVSEKAWNMRQYNKSFKTLRNVAWDCREAFVKPEIIDNYIGEARDFPNFTGLVFDDFTMKGEYKDKLPLLYSIRDKMHNNSVRPMDMWMVLYTREFGLDRAADDEFMKYIEPFDGIMMWTWEEKDVPLIPEKFQIFKRMTPHNRRLFGCYLYNFGEKKQATREAVLWQLDWYRERMYAGEAEGVVLHTNTMCDLDYDAYDAAVEWMDKHGDEEFSVG